jgi:hypothetical protein
MNITFTTQKSRNPSPSSLSNRKSPTLVRRSQSKNKSNSTQDIFIPSYSGYLQNNYGAYKVEETTHGRLSGIKEKSFPFPSERGSLLNQSFKTEHSTRAENTLVYDQHYKQENSFKNESSQKNSRAMSPLQNKLTPISASPGPKLKRNMTSESTDIKNWVSKAYEMDFTKTQKTIKRDDKLTTVSVSKPQQGDYTNPYLILSGHPAQKTDIHEECHKREEELKADLRSLQNALKQMQLITEGIQHSKAKGQSILLDESFRMTNSQDELRSLRAEIESQSKLINDLKSQNEQLKQSQQTMSLAFDCDREKLIKLEDTVRNLRRENQMLKSELNEASFKLNSSKNYKEMNSKYEEEKKRSLHLSNEVERYKSELAKNEKHYMELVGEFNKNKVENHARKKLAPASPRNLQEQTVHKYRTSRSGFKEDHHKQEAFSEPESVILNNEIGNMTITSKNNTMNSNFQPDSFILRKKPESSVFQETSREHRRTNTLQKSTDTKYGRSEKNSMAFLPALESQGNPGNLPSDEKSRIISFLKNYNAPPTFEYKPKSSKGYFDSLMSETN